MASRDVPLALVAVLRPGDTLLIGFTDELDDDTVDMYLEHFKPYIEAGIKIDFLDGVSSMIVVKGE